MHTLSVCCIAKNEEKLLPGMIQSVKKIASEVIVVDTGSTDKTVEVAQDLGAHVEKISWADDFSSARNQALQLAKSEWILMLDADELLVKDSHIAIEKAMSVKHYAYQCNVLHVLPHRVITAFLPMSSVRLFRRDHRIFYENRVHETIDHALRKLTWSPAPSDIKIHHLGFSDALSMRRLRNRRVFEAELNKNPTEPWIRFHLGLGYFLENDIEKAEEYMYFTLSSQSSEIPTEARSMLLSYVAEINRRQGKILQSRSNAQKAISMGGNLFAYYLQASLDMGTENYEGAIKKLREIEAESLSPQFFIVHKGPLYGDLVKCYMKTNKFDYALQYAHLSMEENPTYDAMVIGGYISQQKKDFGSAVQFYERAIVLSPQHNADLVNRLNTCRAILAAS